jgi:hypothetical protein
MATLEQDEAAAWKEYLRDCQLAKLKSGRYDELETWAWARLRARLHAVELRREKTLVAA